MYCIVNNLKYVICPVGYWRINILPYIMCLSSCLHKQGFIYVKMYSMYNYCV